MANPEHLAKVNEGVEAWNQWVKHNPDFAPDLSWAELRGANLRGASLVKTNLSNANLTSADLSATDLSGANLREAHLVQANLAGSNLARAHLSKANLHEASLSGAYLPEADLTRANVSGAYLSRANLSKADLREADLRGANFSRANLMGAKLSGADLRRAYLVGTDFRGANLMDANLAEADLSEANVSEGADLTRATLSKADLSNANLSKANLSEVDLSGADLVETNLRGANLTSCHVYGISAWNVRLEGAIQSNLVITPSDEAMIQVDNLEVAQFVYLLLNNEKIRHVIETITSKVVLILGRFTPERKVVLDAIREELRRCDYLPVLFDFEKPVGKDFTGAVTTLASLARFIIADLTDPRSVPHELAMVIPGTVVPVQTILLEGQQEYIMFRDLRRRFHWVLEPYEYRSKELLIANLKDHVITPAEAKAHELMRN